MITLIVSSIGTIKWLIVNISPGYISRNFHNRFGPATTFKSTDLDWWFYGKPSRISSNGTVYMYFINGIFYDNYLEYVVDTEECIK